MKLFWLRLVLSLFTGFLINADYSQGIQTTTIQLSPSESSIESADQPADREDPPGDSKDTSAVPDDPPGDPNDPPPATPSARSTSPAPVSASSTGSVCYNPASLPATKEGCPPKPASIPPTQEGCYVTGCPTAVPCASQNACPATSASTGCLIQTLNYSYPENTEIRLDIQNPPGFCWDAPCSNNESVVAVINAIDPRNLTPLASHRHILRSLISGTTKVIQNQWDTTRNCIAFSQVYNLVVTPQLKKNVEVGTQTTTPRPIKK